MIKAEHSTRCSQYIEVWYNSIHNLQEEGIISVSYILSDENRAGRLTKALTQPAYEVFVQELGVKCVD